jgi:predicted dehydrogenase
MVNVGIIGAGAWGKNHVRVCRELEGIHLVKVCDLNEDNLSNLKMTFGVETTTDYKELVNDKSIDAIHICTPASAHFALIKEVLEAEKHVLVEKPITIDSKQGEILADLAKKMNKVLMVGHIFRFNSGVLKLKDEIEKGTLGKIRFMYGSRLGLMTPRPDCGVIFDFAIHDIDTACFLLNDMPSEVSATSEVYTNSKHEDVGFITLRFKENILVNIAVSWLTPKKVRELWVVGDKKCAKLDYLSQQLDIFDRGILPEYDSFGAFKLITKEGGEHRPFVQNKEPLKEEIVHFKECIEKGTVPVSNAVVGVNAVKIVEASYKSIAESKTVKVEL